MPFLMPLLGGLLTIVGSLAGRVLLALSIGYVTYSGFDLAVDWLLVEIKNNLGSMGVDTVSFLAWLWVDRAIGMIFSAYSSALLIKMAGSATFSKFAVKS